MEPSALVPFSEWTTPEILPKRFRTWFFAARASLGGVSIDGGEVIDHSWVTADQALALQRSGQIDLPHPTWLTLLTLAPHRDVATALSVLSAGGIAVFRPRIVAVEGGTVSLFEEDAAYASGELDAPGPRHRQYSRNGQWSYERSAD